MADLTLTTSPSKLQRSSIFFPGESAEERVKREKRTSDVQQLLSPTHQYHFKLASRVTDLKSYMDQEFESGIRTMELLMVRELEQKTKLVKKLTKDARRREESLETGPEAIQLKQEIDKYREREQSLDTQLADMRSAEEAYKKAALRLREITRKDGNELRALLKANYTLESHLSRDSVAWSRPVDSSLELTERLKLALPPLSVLYELSPRSIGGMKIDELHGYKSIRQLLRSKKDQVGSQKRAVRSMRIGQVRTTAVPLALEKLYNEGLAGLLQLIPRVLSFDALPSPSLRAPKPVLSHYTKVNLAVLGLGSRKDLVTSLRQQVFPSSVLSLSAAPSPVLSL